MTIELTSADFCQNGGTYLPDITRKSKSQNFSSLFNVLYTMTIHLIFENKTPPTGGESKPNRKRRALRRTAKSDSPTKQPYITAKGPHISAKSYSHSPSTSASLSSSPSTKTSDITPPSHSQ